MALEILIMQGIGPLLFGSSREEAQEHFGACDEKEEMDTSGQHRSEVWHYWERGFSLFFDVENGSRLSCVEIDDTETLLWGQEIFEMNEEEIKSLFRSNGYRELDEEQQEWGEKRVSFDDALVDMYFEQGQLVSVNYGVHLGSSVEKIFSN